MSPGLDIFENAGRPARGARFTVRELPKDAPTFGFSISRKSKIEHGARQACGAHAMYKIDFSQSGIDVDHYLPRKLEAFSMPQPSPLTRFKKKFIFFRPVAALVSKRMDCNFVPQEPLSELDILPLLKANTATKHNVYNVVVTSTEMTIGQLDAWVPQLDWLLSKHVSLANYSADVRFAGEIWKDENDCIHFNARSGSYTPTDEDLRNMLCLARRMFPNLDLKADHIIFH